MTLAIALILTLAATWLSLELTSPELSWDEADYALTAPDTWRRISQSTPHYHGPVIPYLVQAGRSLARVAGKGRVEDRLRFFFALAGGASIGVVYWGMREGIGLSRVAAWVAAWLLLASGIRLRETNLIGPHYPFLLCTVGVFFLGYRYRRKLSRWGSACLGVAFGGAGATMAYVFPLIVAWAAAMLGSRWFVLGKRGLLLRWPVLVALGVGAVTISALWPASLWHFSIFTNLDFYMQYADRGHPTLVGETIYGKPPRMAYALWLWTKELPLLLLSVAAAGWGFWRRWSKREEAPGHRELAGYYWRFSAVLLGTALVAHIAGPRNLLFVVAMLCIGVGVWADRWVGGSRARAAVLGAFVTLGTCAYLRYLEEEPKPALSVGSYREFLDQNAPLTQKQLAATIEGLPILEFYAKDRGKLLSWKAADLPAHPNASAPLAEGTSVILISEWNYRFLPENHPVRAELRRGWKEIWKGKGERQWPLLCFVKTGVGIGEEGSQTDQSLGAGK
jgi:hypothetical protein